MARTIMRFDDLRLPAAADARANPAPAKRQVLTFDDLRPKYQADDGKVQGAIVDGLTSSRLRRDREGLDQRNQERAVRDMKAIDVKTGQMRPGSAPDPREVWDEQASFGAARRESDQRVAGAFGRLDWKRLDPLNVMGTGAQEKLAARFKASLGDQSDLRAYDYDAVGMYNELVGQYDLPDLQAARQKIQETFPKYGEEADPHGLHPSAVIDKFRRENYPDLTYVELMNGLGAKSRAERGMSATVKDEEAPQATYSEAMTETLRAALPRLAADIQVVAADITGNEAAFTDAMRLRRTIQSSVADAQRGNDGTIAGQIGLAGAASLPELFIGGAGGKLAGMGAKRVAGYVAARAAAAAGTVVNAAGVARIAANVKTARQVGSQATFAATVAPASYAEARASGASQSRAALNMVGKVVLEGASESAFFEAASRVATSQRDVLANYGKMILAESGGEVFAEATGTVWDSATLGKPLPTFGEYLQRLVVAGGAGGLLGSTAGSADALRQSAEVWRSDQVAGPASFTEAQRRAIAAGALPPPPATPATPPTPSTPAAPAAAATLPKPAAPAPAVAAAAPASDIQPPPGQSVPLSGAAAPVAPAVASAVPGATAAPVAAPAPAQLPASTDPNVQARMLREVKARQDYEAQVADFEQSEGRQMAVEEREALAGDIATDYEVLRASVLRPRGQPTADLGAATNDRTDGFQQQQSATPSVEQPVAQQSDDGGVDAGGVSAGGVVARPDVPGGVESVGGAGTRVAAGRTDVVGTAAPAVAAPVAGVRANDPDVAVTTRIDGEDVLVLPEQVADFRVAQDAYENGMQMAAAARDRGRRTPIDPKADPDFGLRSPDEAFASSSKSLGMMFAAAKRKATGRLTEKEREAQVAFEAVIRKGDAVVLQDGTPGVVVANPGFGRLTVETAPGRNVTAARSSMVKQSQPVPTMAAAPVMQSATPAAQQPVDQPPTVETAPGMTTQQTLDTAGQVRPDDAEIRFSQRRPAAGAAATASAESVAPVITPVQPNGERDGLPESEGQQAGQGQGQGRQEGLLTDITVEFADEGHREVAIPVEIKRDGKPAMMRAKAGVVAGIVSKRANSCALLLKCLRT